MSRYKLFTKPQRTYVSQVGSTANLAIEFAQGTPGADGTYITNADFFGDDLVFTVSDNTEITIPDAKPLLKGEVGDQGPQGLQGPEGLQGDPGVTPAELAELSASIAALSGIPTLGNLSDEATGETTATVSVDTDKINGRMHLYLSDSNTPPSAADLMDGIGGIKVVKNVEAPGVQSFSVSGLLSSTTYYSHALHEADAYRFSAIATSDGFTTEAVNFVVEDQVHSCGADTQSGVRVASFAANNGSAITSIQSVTGPNASDFLFSLLGNVVEVRSNVSGLSHGPYALSVTVQNSFGLEIVVPFTLSTTENLYTIEADDTQLSAALDDIGPAGGKNIEIRPGTFTTDTMINRAFASRVVIRSAIPPADEVWPVTITAPATTGIRIRNSELITLEGINLTNTNPVGAFGDMVLDISNTNGAVIDGCRLAGKYNDSAGDYSQGYPGSCPAIGYVNPYIPSDFTVTRCLMENISYISEFAWNGDLVVTHNTAKDVFHECIKLHDGVAGSPLGNAKSDGSATIQYNYFTRIIAQPNVAAPASSPHPDVVQVYHQNAGDWHGIDISFNIVHTGETQGYGWQGIFQTSGGDASGYAIAGARIIGNTFVMHGSHHAVSLFAAKDCLILNNTFVAQDPDNPTGFAATITVTEIGGTTAIHGNIADVILATESGGSIVETDNVVLGSSGSTIAYGTTFSGPDFNPLTRNDVIAALTNKPSGPADMDSSGAPSIGDAGSIGSGIITVGEERSDTGWSYDVSYEQSAVPPVNNLLLDPQDLTQGHPVWGTTGTLLLTATSLEDDAAGNIGGRRQTVTVANDDSNYILSSTISADTSSFVSLELKFANGGTAKTETVYFDLSSGAITGSTVGATGYITDIGGGQYRCAIAAANNNTGNLSVIAQLYPARGGQYDTASTGKANFVNNMLEKKAGSVPSLFTT